MGTLNLTYKVPELYGQLGDMAESVLAIGANAAAVLEGRAEACDSSLENGLLSMTITGIQEEQVQKVKDALSAKMQMDQPVREDFIR